MWCRWLPFAAAAVKAYLITNQWLVPLAPHALQSALQLNTGAAKNNTAYTLFDILSDFWFVYFMTNSNTQLIP